MKVRAKTEKGKHWIAEFGDEWFLLKSSDTVTFAQRAGPWGYIRSARDETEERWIHLIDDHNFDIVSL